MRYKVERQTFSDDTDWWVLMREFEDENMALAYGRALDAMDDDRRYRVWDSEVLEGNVQWSSDTIKGWRL